MLNCSQCTHRAASVFQLNHHIQRNHRNVYAAELFHAIVEPEQSRCICCSYKSYYQLELHEHCKSTHNPRTENHENVNICEEHGRYSRNYCRFVSRTIRSERVRRRIVDNRNNQAAGQVASSSSQTRRPRRKRKRKLKTRNYKIVHEVDEATGKTVAVKKRKARKLKSKLRRTNRRRPRLQLGICASMADANALRRRARLKTVTQVTLPKSSVSSSTDVLGSILETQSKLFSENTQFTMDSNSNQVALKNYSSRGPKTTSTINDSVPSSSGRSSNDYNHKNNDSNTHHFPLSSSNIASTLPQDSSEFTSTNANDEDVAQDNSINLPASEEESCIKDKKKEGSESGTAPRSTSPCSGEESDVDIFGDIETVSTSKRDEDRHSPSGPPPQSLVPNYDECTDSEPDMVNDTDKAHVESEDHSAVTSTVDLKPAEFFPATPSVSAINFEIQSQAIQSSSQLHEDQLHQDEEDGCPKFSNYSGDSITLAKDTVISLPAKNGNETQNDCEVSSVDQGMPKPKGDLETEHDLEPQHDAEPEPEPIHQPVQEHKFKPESASQLAEKKKSRNGFYSNSEDEYVIEQESQNNIVNVTEDISEENRSCSPFLVKKRQRLEGLNTEVILDEDENEFDGSQELKTVSGGDALGINDRGSELDFTHLEDMLSWFDKNQTQEQKSKKTIGKEEEKRKKKKEEEEKEPKQQEEILVTVEVAENESDEESMFKQLSRRNKERNYRDKDKQDKDRSKSRECDKQTQIENENLKQKKKRKEIERYDVRAVIAKKLRQSQDEFGRDIRRSTSRSENKSVTPKQSASRARRSSKTMRSLSSEVRRSVPPRTRTRSLSRSWKKKRKRSKRQKRKRFESRRRLSRDRGAKKQRSRSRQTSISRRRERNRSHSRNWTRSPSPSSGRRHSTPSWPPSRRLMESAVKPHNRSMISTDDAKKKDKRKKSENKSKENDKQKKRRRERTQSPFKEVFDPDDFSISASSNKKNETRNDDVFFGNVVKRRTENDKSETPKKQKRNRDLSGIKPVAIIDLESTPIKVIFASLEDVIVLSDSDAEPTTQETTCDSSQQVGTSEANLLSYGPKTPPEWQVEFTSMAKPPQMRTITSPLHEHEEEEVNAQENAQRKGPSTPPEPSYSPSNSPDLYDPLEPIKSESPSPELGQATRSKVDDSSIIESKLSALRKSSIAINALQMTPDALSLHTPPLADIQLADSPSSIRATPKPQAADRVNQSAQTQPSAIARLETTAKSTPIKIVPEGKITREARHQSRSGDKSDLGGALPYSPVSNYQVEIDENNLKILDELPSSAVEMQFLKKLNRQERVVEEIKAILKPYYIKKHINKDDYKDILRRSVPKICQDKSGEINPTKIKNLIEAYLEKIRHSKKVTSSSSVNNFQKGRFF